MTLPNVIVIGAAKAGTTALYAYLAAHPDVYMSPVKEADYFCIDDTDPLRVPRTLEEYEALFAGATTQRAIGEASPRYFNSAAAPGLIKGLIPDAKLIASLRNPADRAFSSYLDRLRSSRERRKLRDALRPGTYYFETSLYAPRLRRYLDRFDRRQVKVLLFENLAADTRGVMRDVFEFIGVDPHFSDYDDQPRNVASVPRWVWLNWIVCQSGMAARRMLPKTVPSMGLIRRMQRPLLTPPPEFPEELRRSLLIAFRQDICETSELLGIDLSYWLTDP